MHYQIICDTREKFNILFIYTFSPFFRKHRNLKKMRLESIDEIFSSTVGDGRSELTLDDFKKLIPSKDVSFHRFNVSCAVLISLR